MNIDTVILSSHTVYLKRSHRNKFLLPVVIYFIQDLCDSFSSKLLTGTPFYKNLTDASYASLVSTSVASSAMTPIKHVYLTLSEILHFSSSVIATRKFLQALSVSGLQLRKVHAGWKVRLAGMVRTASSILQQSLNAGLPSPTKTKLWQREKQREKIVDKYLKQYFI